MYDPDRFEQLVQFRVPTNLSAAIEEAAKKKCQSKSDYARQAIISKLERDGIALQARDAGSLYDRLSDGSRRWALIVGDDIAGMSYHAERPHDGRKWLPVSHVDSEPFDLVKHWRMTPVSRIDGDRVVVEYPVIAKSGDAA